MRIREIANDDLDEVHGLLCEGFPRRSADYWHRALSHMTQRRQVEGLPHFGFLVEEQGIAHGVMLVIASYADSGPRANLSSWYVRPKYRQYATFLYQRAMKVGGATFLNVSPAAHVLP